MKINRTKLVNIILGLSVSLILPTMVLAADPAPAVPPGSGSSSSTGTGTTPTGGGTVTENELFYQFDYKNASTQGTKIGAVKNLPNVPWQVAVANTVKLLLNISGGLALIALTISGVLLITSRGNTDMLEKGKKLALAAVTGLIIIAVSYAITLGVSELQFFTPGAGGGGGPGTAAPAGSTSNAPAAGGSQVTGTGGI